MKKVLNNLNISLSSLLTILSFIIILGSLLIGFVGISVMQWELGFQESSSAFAESLVDLYNFVWVFLNFTLVLVFVALTRILYLFIWNLKILNWSFFKAYYNVFFEFYHNIISTLFYSREKVVTDLYKFNKIINNTIKFSIFYLNYDKYEFLNITDLNEHKKLEVIWSILPAVILLILIGPTFSLIFSLDPDIDPVFTVKVVGHQWWWSYELHGLCYNELHGVEGTPKIGKNWFSFDFDSTMKAEEDLEMGQLRLLEVDNKLILPVCLPIRFLITATDVLHSWAVPSLGLKVDAIPGRLNQFLVEIKRPGVFYGQCSELCGREHGFMPIVIQALELKEFEKWLNSFTKLGN